MSAVAEHEVVRAPERADGMLHTLHHFEGTVAVAWCGYRKDAPKLFMPVVPVECVVCAALCGEVPS